METNLIDKIIAGSELGDFREWLAQVFDQDQALILRNEVIQTFRSYCDAAGKSEEFRSNSSLFEFLRKVQVLFPCGDHLVVMRRLEMGQYLFYLIRKDGEYVEETTQGRYFEMQQEFIYRDNEKEKYPPIDFRPFYHFTPEMRDSRTIGSGMKFLSQFLSEQLFENPEVSKKEFFEFMKVQKVNGKELMINGSIIEDENAMEKRLAEAVKKLGRVDPGSPLKEIESTLAENGFEAGWGDTAGRVRDTMKILLDLINKPSEELLEEFMSRVPVPLISRIAIISPHGWFGQTNTLGKPDTGGQVIYILDQVRVLESCLKELFRSSGLDIEPHIIVLTRLIPDAGDTTCDQRMEKIFNTDNAWILRVPFRDGKYNIIKHWISRFQIWPYLERFADDSIHELTGALHGRPDLVIGNYSDGNLVASLLADHFDTTQCMIAHALEKPKYHLSDVYWQEREPEYNFSIQFTADIYSMNKADFIITSTLQEIVGTDDTMGQYESYQFFAMPGLYQADCGVNLFEPKFNVVPPGVDEEIYYPFREKDRRIQAATGRLRHHLLDEKSNRIYGELTDPEKKPVFTMARFDKIKNITGLIEAFGMSEELREECNLIFAAGLLHPEDTTDYEEKSEIERAWSLIESYKLEGKVRWLPSIPKLDTGEVYRIVADMGGIFVQPALFEAFGLTVLEAMASGLPTFAPRFGGPLEIIQFGVNGYLLNTSTPELIARSLENFFNHCRENTGHWKEISEGGIKRVHEAYNWNRYSESLVNLTKLYGFWRHAVSGKAKEELDRYCDLIYHFLIRERAKRLVQ